MMWLHNCQQFLSVYLYTGKIIKPIAKQIISGCRFNCAMCDKGSIKANSDNIRVIDIFMITDILKNYIRFYAEIRGAKASRWLLQKAVILKYIWIKVFYYNLIARKLR